MFHVLMKDLLSCGILKNQKIQIFLKLFVALMSLNFIYVCAIFIPELMNNRLLWIFGEIVLIV